MIGDFFLEFCIYLAYTLETFFCCYYFMSRYERRSRFALRVALCIVGMLALIAGVAFLQFAPWDTERSTPVAVFKFSLPHAAIFAYFMICYRPKIAILFFCGTYAAFFRNWAGNISKMISGYTLLSGWGELALKTAVCVALIIVAFFAFARKIKGYLVETMDAVYVWLINLCSSMEILLFMAASSLFSDSPAFSTAIDVVNILVGILFLWFYYVVARKCYLIREMTIANYAAKAEHKQYENLKRNADAVNAKWHDLKYYIAAFERSGKANESDIAGLKKIADGYGENVVTGNETLDLILTDKSRLCSGKDIAFQCFADGSCMGFMSAGDIFSLFGNLIDNAVEYTSRFGDKEKRYIALRVKRVSNLLSVSSENYYEGEEKTEWTTTKNDKISHGFGLRNIRSIAEKYGGQMQISVKRNIFSVDIAIPIPP